MNATSLRRKCGTGLAQIVRFNWTFYAIVGAGAAVAVVLATEMPLPPLTRAAMFVGIGVAIYFVVASLAVSFWIYDCSQLMTWRWIVGELPDPPRRWINLHCGLDESTPALRRLFPDSIGRVLDIFDPTEMTAPSIHRARVLARPTIVAMKAQYDRLPIDDGEYDAAFVLLSAHELRHHRARVALFRELLRALRRGGRVVLAEHLRDTANFLAFGPGFFHFHSAAAWRLAARDAGFDIACESRITPFVRVFNLRKPA